MDIKFAKITTTAGRFWMRWYRLIFFIFLFAACGLGAYIWRQSIYASNWSEIKKIEYSQSLRKEVVFNEQDFNWLLERNREKENVMQGGVSSIQDIFKLGNSE